MEDPDMGGNITIDHVMDINCVYQSSSTELFIIAVVSCSSKDSNNQPVNRVKNKRGILHPNIPRVNPRCLLVTVIP